jgi:hypothetical protein
LKEYEIPPAWKAPGTRPLSCRTVGLTGIVATFMAGDRQQPAGIDWHAIRPNSKCVSPRSNAVIGCIGELMAGGGFGAVSLSLIRAR